ncbi:MAG: hypothetical protein LBF69_00445 [Prevotellaceae bacterium]|jgi:dsRNA-specific ribonuclease|nr:hypothetical protein [Prevotellaceae bacterium]
MKITKNVVNGITLTFTEDGDKFKISSEDPQLQQWIEERKTRRVKQSEIHFAVDAAKKFLETGIAQGQGRYNPCNEEYQNPIIELAEKCQRKWGKSIITNVLGKTGPDHCPVVKVSIILPNRREYLAVGNNQKVAKEIAARKALAEF